LCYLTSSTFCSVTHLKWPNFTFSMPIFRLLHSTYPSFRPLTKLGYWRLLKVFFVKSLYVILGLGLFGLTYGLYFRIAETERKLFHRYLTRRWWTTSSCSILAPTDSLPQVQTLACRSRSGTPVTRSSCPRSVRKDNGPSLQALLASTPFTSTRRALSGSQDHSFEFIWTSRLGSTPLNTPPVAQNKSCQSFSFEFDNSWITLNRSRRSKIISGIARNDCGRRARQPTDESCGGLWVKRTSWWRWVRGRSSTSRNSLKQRNLPKWDW
jgi:hypothetical protein